MMTTTMMLGGSVGGDDDMQWLNCQKVRWGLSKVFYQLGL